MIRSSSPSLMILLYLSLAAAAFGEEVHIMVQDAGTVYERLATER